MPLLRIYDMHGAACGRRRFGGELGPKSAGEHHPWILSLRNQLLCFHVSFVEPRDSFGWIFRLYLSANYLENYGHRLTIGATRQCVP